MIEDKSFPWKICCFLFTISMIQSLKSWFFFSVNSVLFSLTISLFILFAYFNNKRIYSLSNNVFKVIIVFFLARFLATRGNANSYLGGIIIALPFILFLCLNKNYRLLLYIFFNKTFAIIISVSLVGWIAFLFGIPLPHQPLYFGDISEYSFDNYYVFLCNTKHIHSIYRFSSIFLEPGFFACIMVAIMYIEKFNFRKWYNIVYFVALLLTFSLGGYLIFAFFFILKLLKSSKNKVYQIMIGGGILSAFLYFSNTNSAFSEMIYDRLEYDSNKKNITGYNRSSAYINDYWNNIFFVSDDILFGVGNDMEIEGVDYKCYIIKYGILGAFAYLFYLFFLCKRNLSYDSFIYFLLFVSIWSRGFHVIFFTAFLAIYVMGLDKISTDR